MHGKQLYNKMHNLDGPGIWVCADWSGTEAGWSLASLDLVSRLGPKGGPDTGAVGINL